MTFGIWSGKEAFVAAARCFKSTGLMLAAATLMSTSPGPGAGSGKSPYSITSGPPYSFMTTAFIAVLLTASESRPGASENGESSVRHLYLDVKRTDAKNLCGYTICVRKAYERSNDKENQS